MSEKQMTYAGAGVNYDVMDPHKRNSQLAAAQTGHLVARFGFEVVEWSRGESAFLVKTPFGYIAFVVEGLGTKNLVADALYQLANDLNMVGLSYYDRVAVCNCAMAFNDMITSGALPVVYSQYLAAGRSRWFEDEARSRDLIDGTMRACELARCTWGGGETPSLVGIVDPTTVDLAGATWGIVKHESHLINPANIRHGDTIVFIESSGIHANGLTLARRIADKLSEGYYTQLADGRTYGETLLDSTHIYVGLIEDCHDAGVEIHSAVNITGHGWRKLMRATQPFTYVIETLPTQRPIFNFLQKHGPLDDREAYGNLNMGAGFALYVPERDVSKVLEVAEGLGFRAFAAGYIEEGDKRVVIEPKKLVYEGDTLAVR